MQPNNYNYIKSLAKNILFLIQTSWVCITEILLYFLYKNYDLSIKRFTKNLASLNILYVKVFQSLALNNSIVNDKLNSELFTYTDNAPFTKDDIDYDCLLSICMDHDIVFINGFDNPINSGMISLVYLARDNKNNNIIIKIKRKNIEKKLEEGISNLLFFINLLHFIPFIKNYKISENIQKNIDIIKGQTNFSEEISNLKRMQTNCKNLDYIKIPNLYDNINNNYTNVIAMEYINGKKFNELDKEDYIVFAKQIIKFGIVTAFIYGFSHGDFHVGNILFIKENIKNENVTYKLGVIDFGIMTEIKDPFKSNLLSCLATVFQDSSVVSLNKFFNSGIFEPCIIKNVLPEAVYENLINSNIHLVEDFIHSKKLKQIHLFEIFKILFGFINNNTRKTNGCFELFKYGIVPSEMFFQLQFILAMANGVTFALCQDKTMEVINDVVNELFHLDLLMDE